VVLGACAGPGTPANVTRALIEPWLTTSVPARDFVNGTLNGSAYAEPKLGVVHDVPHGLVMVDGRSLEDIERDAVVCTLHRFNGHRQKTATALGIGVRTLGLKLKKWKELHLVEAEL
jgi:DNA-binding NtrC family response regulator